jgi:hypothetical protein
MLIKGKSLKQWYGAGMKCYGAGYGLALGRVQGILNLALIGSSYLLLKGYEPSFTETIIFGIVAILSIFIIGAIFIKLGLQKAEMGSLFMEQPQQKEMYERIQVMSDQIQSINEYLAKKAQEEITPAPDETKIALPDEIGPLNIKFP